MVLELSNINPYIVGPSEPCKGLQDPDHLEKSRKNFPPQIFIFANILLPSNCLGVYLGIVQKYKCSIITPRGSKRAPCDPGPEDPPPPQFQPRVNAVQ